MERRQLTIWCAAFMTALGVGGAGCGDDEAVEGAAPFDCVSPQAVLVGEVETGFERCASGELHRPAQVACPSALPREGTTCEPSEGSTTSECTTDAECAGLTGGHCRMYAFEGTCRCATGCTSDADCGDGQVCLCGDPVGQCVAATCASDDDCAGALRCTSYTQDPGCGGTAFACQTEDDGCASDADCPEGELCTLEGERHVCQGISCAIGRPFLVEGAERLAAATRRDDWQAQGLAPEVASLAPGVRALLAERWTEMGLMEHASVAAFARFAMQLLSLGAPPELLDETHQAMADETAHARLCFALASRYAAQPIGPGPLPIEGALAEASLGAILEVVILEGCVGETVAALEAREALAHAVDPVVRGVLERVAHDERRHALLAWRTVRWALEAGDAQTREQARDAFAAACAMLRAAPAVHPDAQDRRLLVHGVVSPSSRDALRRAVVEQLVEPCAQAMLAAATPDASLSWSDQVGPAA